MFSYISTNVKIRCHIFTSNIIIKNTFIARKGNNLEILDTYRDKRTSKLMKLSLALLYNVILNTIIGELYSNYANYVYIYTYVAILFLKLSTCINNDKTLLLNEYSRLY